MNDNEKKWIKAWKSAGPALDEIRKKELKSTVTGQAIEALSDAYEWSLRSYKEKATSGLVEQQKIFSKVAKIIETE
ncbi:MAG: hypothetical protein KDD56_00140 [Bdellovibrionales bacterium]|nr:hypothetical protein [Bdellovibrionales bacterium]